MIHETLLVVSRDTIVEDVERIHRHWTDGSKHLISHYLAPIDFRKIAKFTGTDHELIKWVEEFPHKVGAIYVVSDHNVVYDMNKLRPELVFYRVVVRDDCEIDIQEQISDDVRLFARAC